MEYLSHIPAIIFIALLVFYAIISKRPDKDDGDDFPDWRD